MGGVSWAVFATLLNGLEATALVQPGQEIHLWSHTAPGDQPGRVGPEVHLNRTYGPSHYPGFDVKNVTEPTLTPFLVSKSDSAVIIAPGGGYEGLAITLEGTAVAERLNSFGVNAFVLKYRVPLRPPVQGLPWNWAQLQDAQRAVGLVRGRAAEWGIDPKKIGFLGFSAGGHLTAHISTAWGHRLYAPVDSYDSVSCRPDMAFLIYPWRLLKGNHPTQQELAPELNVTPQTTPAFIVGNNDDPDAYPENYLEYYRVLHRHAKVSASLHIFPSGGHGFGMGQVFTSPKACCAWPELARTIMQEKGFAPPTVTARQEESPGLYV